MPSTIPAVLSGLVAAFRDTPDLSTAEVIDGAPITGLDRDALIVGYGGDDNAVEVERGSNLVGQTETYVVMCSLWVWSGSTDIAALRDRAFAYLTAAVEKLREDTTVGGAAARTHVVTLAFDQAQTQDGATAELRFGIHVDGFIR